MKLNLIALAGAFLALTAAAAQASAQTVVPDTLHRIGSDARQVHRGTKKGVGDQYRQDKAAAVRTTRDARSGWLLHHHNRHSVVRNG